MEEKKAYSDDINLAIAISRRIFRRLFSVRALPDIANAANHPPPISLRARGKVRLATIWYGLPARGAHRVCQRVYLASNDACPTRNNYPEPQRYGAPDRFAKLNLKRIIQSHG